LSLNVLQGCLVCRKPGCKAIVFSQHLPQLSLLSCVVIVLLALLASNLLGLGLGRGLSGLCVGLLCCQPHALLSLVLADTRKLHVGSQLVVFDHLLALLKHLCFLKCFGQSPVARDLLSHRNLLLFCHHLNRISWAGARGLLCRCRVSCHVCIGDVICPAHRCRRTTGTDVLNPFDSRCSNDRCHSVFSLYPPV
jgi:hypothetical protein